MNKILFKDKCFNSDLPSGFFFSSKQTCEDILKSDINVYAEVDEYNFTDPAFLPALQKVNPRNLTFILCRSPNSTDEFYRAYGNVKYWSNYFVYPILSNKGLDIEKYLSIQNTLQNTSDITIPFTLYFRRPKPFRKYLYNILSNNDILKYGDWTHNKSLQTWNIKYWHESYSFIPDSFNNTLLDIVCETYNHDNEKYFFTEKTWRPILWGKPFLIAGVAGINKELKSMGFELYDEIIDYSFDNETDVNKRMEMIALQIATLCKSNFDLNKIYRNLLYPKINYNRKLMMNNILEGKYLPKECLENSKYVIAIEEAKKNATSVLKHLP